MQDTSFSKPPPTLPVAESVPPLPGQIEDAWPSAQWSGVHVVLAVSGGADSVALLRAMLELKRRHGGAGDLQVAHLNHGMRGAEADEDQRWIAALCQSLGVRLWTNRMGTGDYDTREGWEAAARSTRYEFLTRTAEQIGARFVATAHTADDQVETVLHRVLRGTGIDGLTGIPFARPLAPSVTLIRPMLDVKRTDVVFYLKALGQEFRNDSSNSSSRFTRNWLRNELLPMIRERLNPEVDAALLRLSKQAGEMQLWLAERVNRLLAKTAKTARTEGNGENGEIRITRFPLRNLSPFEIRELCKRAWQQAGWPLRDMGYDQWQQLAEMVRSGSDSGAAIVLPSAVRAEVCEGTLVLRRTDVR